MNSQLFCVARDTNCADCGRDLPRGALVSIEPCLAGVFYRCGQCAMVPYESKTIRLELDEFAKLNEPIIYERG